ncbi:tryptophan-rich sensory protein [Halomonas aquamarina]|uniref:Tryptophan-rich sensory protein n=1 Tax=Vreelandella aquamarina TaxID=77097 RepID=A0ACC5VV74_9GAMM|nr:TspO/MBR family protein [Halomonas aquamarina]MBZ5488171.1 tryptophan-rich sensory protein [Halomonas aquamarina]
MTCTLSRKKQILGLIGWLVLAYLAAAIGAVASINAAAFYESLQQPAWAPPTWLFGPMWTTLYGLMGIAAWLAWRERGARPALTVFVVQLALNALWSWLFFVWNLGAISFIATLVLWVLILVTLLMFWRLKRLAGILLVPYLAWVSLACALTWSVWQLNPQVFG